MRSVLGKLSFHLIIADVERSDSSWSDLREMFVLPYLSDSISTLPGVGH